MLVDYCRLSDSIPHLTLSHTQQKEQKKGQTTMYEAIYRKLKLKIE
jgi:hypothetical protein